MITEGVSLLCVNQNLHFEGTPNKKEKRKFSWGFDEIWRWKMDVTPCFLYCILSSAQWTKMFCGNIYYSHGFGSVSQSLTWMFWEYGGRKFMGNLYILCSTFSNFLIVMLIIFIITGLTLVASKKLYHKIVWY